MTRTKTKRTSTYYLFPSSTFLIVLLLIPASIASHHITSALTYHLSFQDVYRNSVSYPRAVHGSERLTQSNFFEIRMLSCYDFPQRNSETVDVDRAAVGLAAKYFRSPEKCCTHGQRTSNVRTSIIGAILVPFALIGRLSHLRSRCILSLENDGPVFTVLPSCRASHRLPYASALDNMTS